MDNIAFILQLGVFTSCGTPVTIGHELEYHFNEIDDVTVL